MKTFPRGGVHPSDNKLSRAEAVEVLALPDVVNVPLSQHIGAPAVAKVAKGDKVKVGELIAEAAGFVSANIHAPVSGTVTGVDMLPNGQGIRQMMITIRREGDEWAEGIDTSKELVRECTLSAPEILARIKEAGNVGVGGGGYRRYGRCGVPHAGQTDGACREKGRALDYQWCRVRTLPDVRPSGDARTE